MYDLYVVTDKSLSKGRSDAEVAEAAFAGGATTVQLRMKDADREEMLREARLIKKSADKYNGFFIVNDRVDIALLSEADGVHLGQDDMTVADARRILGDFALIGVTVHNVEEAVKASEDGADYVGVGSIFNTATKPDAPQGLGLGVIFEIKEAIDLPVVAIGGINRGNIQDVIRAGADGAAVVSAVVAQDDIAKAAHELRDMILKVRPHIPKE